MIYKFVATALLLFENKGKVSAWSKFTEGDSSYHTMAEDESQDDDEADTLEQSVFSGHLTLMDNTFSNMVKNPVLYFNYETY